jgi:hypothetical protein
VAVTDHEGGVIVQDPLHIVALKGAPKKKAA